MSRSYQLFFTFAYKEGLGFAPLQSADNTYSEFLKNVSRGKFSYPPVYLFDFCDCLFCYTFFKARSEIKKCCDKIFLQAYKLIYESTDNRFENVVEIIK